MALWVTVVLPFALAALIIMLVDRMRNRHYWKLLARVPGPKPLPLLGNIREIGIFSTACKHFNPVAVFLQTRVGLATLYRKEKLYKLLFGRTATVLLTHPDTVQPLLNSNSSLEKGNLYRFFHPWLGLGLLTSAGDKWRRDRKLLTPTFHFQILANFVSIMNEQASIMVEKLRLASDTCQWLDPFHFVSFCTLDIICETAMGCRLGAQEKSSDYVAAIRKATYLLMNRLSKPWVHNDWLYSMTTEGKEFAEAIHVIKRFTKDVISRKIRQRESMETTNVVPTVSGLTPRKRLAFLDMLLESELSADEMREHADTFMFAGHDTTYTALSWILYLLGLYPDVQEKVAEEVDRVWARDRDSHVDEEHIKQLKYMDCVIKETQRLYPSVPGISRKLAEDTTFGDYLVPKGTEVMVPFYSLHHNPDVFPDPEIFDPDRFLLDKSSSRNPFAFIPFSAGPRNCIGQRFAMNELRVLLCYILRHFRLQSRDQRDKIFLVSEVVLRPTEPLKIKFIPK